MRNHKSVERTSTQVSWSRREDCVLEGLDVTRAGRTDHEDL